MKVIAGNRRTGRTTKLIELCWEAHQKGDVVYLVAHSVREAQNIFRRAMDRGYEGFPFPLSLEEATNYHGAPATFYMDNAELLISRAFPMNVAAFTVTTEND